MPPKPKFTKEEIVKTALELVSDSGADALTARELGKRLGSSSRPIFTMFSGMDEVLEEVRKAAMEKFENYMNESPENIPEFKRVGMKMVLFGKNEPKLFRLLFMSEHPNALSFNDIFSELGEDADRSISAIRRDYGLTDEKARILFKNLWIYTFGIGVMCASGVCNFTENEISEMLTVEFKAMLAYVNE